MYKEQNRSNWYLGNDPLVKLRARELDLKAQENMRRQKEDDNRLNLDKMKSLMNQNLQEEKMEHQEDLAILRATTSLEKQKMSNKVKMKNDKMKQQDVIILKKMEQKPRRVCTITSTRKKNLVLQKVKLKVQ